LRQVEARLISALGALEAGLCFFLGNALVVVGVDDLGPRELMGAVEFLPARLVRLERLGRRPGLGEAEPLRQLLIGVFLVPLGLLGGEAAQHFRAVLVGGPKAEFVWIAQDLSNRMAAWVSLGRSLARVGNRRKIIAANPLG